MSSLLNSNSEMGIPGGCCSSLSRVFRGISRSASFP